MTTPSSGLFLGVLALLCSSAGLAATVNVVSSDANPNVGDTFYVTVSGVGFPETFGATLGLTFNSDVVNVSSVELAPGSPFSGGAVATLPVHSGDEISVLGPLTGAGPSGSFDVFRITFTVVGPGKADIVFVDDRQNRAWSDANGSPIPAAYNQVNVVAGPGAGPLAVDDSVTTERGVAVVVAALANDKGMLDPATVSISSSPLQGTAQVSGSPGAPSGIRITYTPVAGFTGSDSFGYSVATNGGTAGATVTISVTEPTAGTDTVASGDGMPLPYIYALLLGVVVAGVILYLRKRRK